VIATAPHPPGLAHYSALYDALNRVGYLPELDVTPALRRTPPDPPVLTGGYTSAAIRIPAHGRYHTPDPDKRRLGKFGTPRPKPTEGGILVKGETIEQAAVICLQTFEQHPDASVRKALGEAAIDLGLT
jgi:hypothetical protein